MPPLRVAVLQGGESPERAISLQTGSAVDGALRAAGHEVWSIDPAESDPAASVAGIDRSRCDVVFIALHGRFGEDGEVQGLLEARGLAYTGSGPAACRLAMNKWASKQAFWRHGIDTPLGTAIHRLEPPGDPRARVDRLGWPVVVKPNREGSSLGVSIVRRPETLAAALARSFDFGPLAVAERYIAGRELTVALLDGVPLPIVEVHPAGEFFDDHAKYVDPGTQVICPARLDPSRTAEVQRIAQRAAGALGCRGLCRVDLIVDPSGRPWVLEVNAIPGMTPHSLAPRAAAAAGIDFVRLCDHLVRSADRCGP